MLQSGSVNEEVWDQLPRKLTLIISKKEPQCREIDSDLRNRVQLYIRNGHQRANQLF